MKSARDRSVDGVVPIGSVDGRWYDLRPFIDRIGGSTLTPRSRAQITAVAAGHLLDGPAADEDPAPPQQPSKIVCIGLNYRDHAEETNATPPTEPVIFIEAPDTVVEPDDEVLVPRNSVKTDYEVELAVVIGSLTRYLNSPAASLTHVAGHATSNDVSERAFQIDRGGQWDKSKNCVTFNAVRPWIRTSDEARDPQTLGLRLSVNGRLRQGGNIQNMIFGVASLIWYVSQFMTLYPGDLINTGTAAGVAMGRPDKPFLRAGDVVEVEIDGLRCQRQTIGQA
jgi:2-keto-4-pentenoate hydratase/2-oxohepta-3-ene-1,7-dioic acid hydratase in catechol pathway